MYITLRNIALGLLVAAAVASAGPQGAAPAAQCPAADLCYSDTANGKPIVACTWACGEAAVPNGCVQRCRPCQATVCLAGCVCEIACPAAGPCKAAPAK
ncbi:hypothetical protein H4R18_003965 [Coemansia javaensis]|uniref:Uncharacterized protein n=1 Tax=Coemansia javaensis TaxID=2761396 RepID=A0A9W8HC81_9FUNG|nr:hypothetical protein H4R18_003965 [Coemansia javaensis]